jgi:hypothetical protein
MYESSQATSQAAENNQTFVKCNDMQACHYFATDPAFGLQGHPDQQH